MQIIFGLWSYSNYLMIWIVSIPDYSDQSVLYTEETHLESQYLLTQMNMKMFSRLAPGTLPVNKILKFYAEHLDEDGAHELMMAIYSLKYVKYPATKHSNS